MKKVLNIIRIIVLTILTVYVIINGTLYIKKNVFKVEVPTFFDYTYLKVVSGSMQPTINVNDTIIVKITNDVELKDIVVYKEENHLVTHRLVRIDGESYYTEGDFNGVEEEIKKSQVIGKVVYHEDSVLNVIGFITKPIVLIIMGILFLIVPDIIFPKKK